MPQLHFVHDESIRTGERLSALIDQVTEDSGADAGDPPGI
jgi:ribosome-binding factor A